MDRLPHLLRRNAADALWRLHAVHRGHRRLWQQHQRRLGLPDRELRLVDRPRQRRHPDLLPAGAHPPVVARHGQPFRRGDDPVRGVDRRALPDLSSRATALFLLARPLSRHDAVWPQWRSALVWDFWAISAYLIFSILFWYVGLLPDLATVRDRSKSKLAARSTALRARLARLGQTLAPLCRPCRSCWRPGVPLVCSVHSDGRPRFRREPDARAGASRFTRPVSSSARCFPALP